VNYADKQGLLAVGESYTTSKLEVVAMRHARANPETPAASDLLSVFEAYRAARFPNQPLPVRVRLDPEPDFSIFRGPVREIARKALDEGDVEGLLILETNELALQIAAANAGALRERGLLEKAFVHAWIATRTNWVRVPLRELRALIRLCDRDRLRAEGDPIPPGASFTLYRGVSGRGHRRRESGLSWTRDAEKAGWFATRFDLERPAVLRAEVCRGEVLFYSNDRDEDDFVLFARDWEQVRP
jgi:hypothetical protein